MKTSVDIYRAFLQLKNISSEIFCYIDFEKSILTAYSSSEIPAIAPFPASPKTALWWEFLRFRPRFASLDSGPRGDGEVDWELYLFCQESTKRETGIACLSFWCRRLCRWQRQAAAVC